MYSHLRNLRADGLLNEVYVPDNVLAKPDESTKQYLGFCLNERCHPNHKRYHVKANTGRIATLDKGVIFCESCKHALYWSNHYRENDERKRHSETNFAVS